jgi:hypothetical protein
MVTREVGFQFFGLPLLAALLLIAGCQTKDISVEKSPGVLVSGNIDVETHPPSRSKSIPATTGEVVQAVRRIYGNAISVDGGSSCLCVTGDFNADGSEDLAAVVRPLRRNVAELNNELANWILEDPLLVRVPDSTNGVQPFPPKPMPARVAPGDLLLAVIHGYGHAGWRDPRARQSYLLRNAAGHAMHSRASVVFRQIPALRQRLYFAGDVIVETLAEEPGFLFWTGSKYAWQKYH